MDNKKNGIPKLRFPGFTGAWEQRKLGEVVEDYIEKTTVENQYPILTSSQQMGIVLQDTYFSGTRVSESGNTGYFILPRGYFSYRSRSDNDTYVFNRNDCIDKGIISHYYPVFKPSGVDSDFLLRRLNNGLKKQLSIVSEGTGQHVLSLKKFKNIETSFPNIREQQKIGKFFKQLDFFIALHQRKLEHLQEQKKGLLQKMFPKNGETVPEVRFPGFTDAWEQRKLGEVGKTFTGLSGKTKEDFGHGDAHFVTYMNVYSNPISDPNMVENVEIDTKQQEVKKGDVFFTTSSETPEEVGMSSVWLSDAPHIYLNSFCFGFRPTVNIFNPYYLAYLLRSNNIRNKMMILAQGISRYNISKNKVMKLDVTIPNIREQQKIGEFFKQLDTLITLHQRKLEHLELMKKGLLQQMFV